MSGGDGGAAYPAGVVAAEVMDGAVVRRWCRLSAEALGQTRAAIDALNVYPVPDADTGTNLYRTLLSAAQAVDELPATATPSDIWHAAATGAMLGACGNSGIILSQLLRGLADVCGPAAPCDGLVVARALGHAAGLARAAVSRPVEGTVLTVADAAARAAAAVCTPPGSTASGSPASLAEAAGVALAAVVLAAAAAARQALGLTTGQLAVLAERGVVDAGGAGLCVVLDAWAAAIGGTTGTFEVPRPGPGLAALRATTAASSGGRAESPGYEVTYLLEAPAAAMAGLREELDALGDSLVIAGGGESADPDAGGRWSVHVHVPEAGPAIEAGLRLGRPRRITVSYLGLPPAAGHGVLALCDTPGLAALAEAAGAEVLCYGSGEVPAAGEISMAVRRLARRCIIVPNGSSARAAATAAARDLGREGIEVVVVDVRSAVQALPALAVHEPAAGFAADAAAMERAASRMRHGLRHADPAGAALATTEVLAMIDELLAGGAELMTLLIGAQAPAGLAERAVAHVRAVSPATEVECHVGAVPGAVVLAGAE
jgi:dihydroxyacetone kinase-like predicted kinase